jgi:hypothetical protein
MAIARRFSGMMRPVPAAVFDLPTTSDFARKSTCPQVRSRISFARIPVLIANRIMGYKLLHRLFEAAEFLVFTSPRTAFTLPKRCFESSQGVATLRELFRTYVETSNLRPD